MTVLAGVPGKETIVGKGPTVSVVATPGCRKLTGVSVVVSPPGPVDNS